MKTQKEWRGTMEAFRTGGAPYDLGLHRIPKPPFFARPHENDMPAFLKNSKIRKRCLKVPSEWKHYKSDIGFLLNSKQSLSNGSYAH